MCLSLRRLLQPAWDLADLAFSWLREKPPIHRAVMPWQVLATMISACLIYGWVAVAGCLAISWGGLARVGEVLAARRSDLVLLEDVGEHLEHILQMVVQDPKTRFRGG